MKSSILTEKPIALYEYFLIDYKELFDIDLDKASRIRKDNSLFTELIERWYEHLDAGNLDEAFKVYDDDYYFVDIFNCFVGYSRNYIKRLLKPSLPDDRSIYDLLKNTKSFVDIGCGISYSTCALKELFPDATGYAINLKDTKQWKLCEIMAARYDFNLIESVDDVKHEVDFVFASEYFEHIYNPTEHVREIMDAVSPKYFIIANAFNTSSIGHFREYEFEHSIVDGRKMSKIFNLFMKQNGYEKVECKMWNSKPMVWRRIDD
jgi:hypothetical protein